MSYGVIELGQYWLRPWLNAMTWSNADLLFTRSLGTNFGKIFESRYLFFQENSFKNAMFIISGILFRIWCVNIESIYHKKENREKVWISIVCRLWAICQGPFHQRFFARISNSMGICLALIPLLSIRSQNYFARATTTQLPLHAQDFLTIALLE